uniref:non-specific serine/threonine protein kinase n=1 Tax=Solanum lycopersicum TaxID=4081 RepID=K4CD61_SOLLC
MSDCIKCALFLLKNLMKQLYAHFLYSLKGQAEKEFKVEVEAIGHVCHKNLVSLLEYSVEGIHK